MLYIFGTRPRGRVHVASGGYVETDFFCAQGLPVFPVGTFFVNTEQNRRQPLRPAARSIAAGYVRGWTALPLAFVVFVAVYFASGAESGGQMLAIAFVPLTFAALLTAVLFAAMRIGRLSSAQLLEWEAYGRACGASVDVALLADDDQRALRASLLAAMDNETRARMAESYRAARPAAGAYVDVAAGVEVPSLDYLCGALTLVRLDGIGGTPEKRALAARAHATILARIASRATDGLAPNA